MYSSSQVKRLMEMLRWDMDIALASQELVGKYSMESTVGLAMLWKVWSTLSFILL